MDDAWRDRLREEVAKSGLGLTTLSNRAGLNRSYLSRLLEQDSKQTPNLRALGAVCHVLDTSLSWITDGVPQNDEIERVLRAFMALDEHSRAAALTLVETMADKIREAERLKETPPVAEEPGKANRG